MSSSISETRRRISSGHASFSTRSAPGSITSGLSGFRSRISCSFLFVARDSLFYTGIAGPVAGIPLLVGTGILIFTIVRTITGSHPIAFLSAVLLGLNPNLVYMALTPMNEPSLLFLFSLGAMPSSSGCEKRISGGLSCVPLRLRLRPRPARPRSAPAGRPRTGRGPGLDG